MKRTGIILLALMAACQVPPHMPNSPMSPVEWPELDSGPALERGDATAARGLLDRQHPDDVRLVSYNIHFDAPFVDGSEAARRFARLVKALDADIWALQEVYKTPTADVAALMDRLAPLPDGRRWQAHRGGDSVTVSRHPVTLHNYETVPSCGRRVSLSLVDLPDARYPRDIYLLNNHFKCCGSLANDTQRQLEADQLVAWMRDARTAGGSITLPHGTPMVIVGDLNTVGSPVPLETLLGGDIVNEGVFGKDSAPDWDGTPLTDAHPHHLGGTLDWTWRWDDSGYLPGRLDYIIYTDSAASTGNRFVLNTMALSPQQLAAADLQAEDVILNKVSANKYAFDHLPVVVDFQIQSK